MKLVERMPRLCKAVIKAVATLKNLKYKIYFDLLTLFWLLHDPICVFNSYLMSPLLFYNVENSKNKEKLLTE